MLHNRQFLSQKDKIEFDNYRPFNKQRINLSALSLGPAIRMLDEAVAYAKEREQFGQPIAEFQLVQAMLAECKVEIEAARALILETARKRDRGEDVVMDVSLCKYFSTEMCGRVADRVAHVVATLYPCRSSSRPHGRRGRSRSSSSPGACCSPVSSPRV